MMTGSGEDVGVLAIGDVLLRVAGVGMAHGTPSNAAFGRVAVCVSLGEQQCLISDAQCTVCREPWAQVQFTSLLILSFSNAMVHITFRFDFWFWFLVVL